MTTSTLPQVTTIQVNAVELFTRSIGAGPDVVVLHGGPGAHHDYLLPQFDELARGRKLRYYDQRGGGRSPVDRDVPVGAEEQVADLDALIETWGLTPATLLGYSWGGLLALLYAAAHPGRVGRLALVSPAAITREYRTEFERRFAERSADPRVLEARETLRQSGLREGDPNAYRQRMFELSVAGYFHDPERARDLTPFRVTGRTQDAVWRSLSSYDLTGPLATLRVPTLILHGRYDPIPLESSEQLARLLGARIEVLENSGHVPYIEDHDRFIALLDQFLPKVA